MHTVTAYVFRGLRKVTAEDAKRLTHLNIAFGLIKDGRVITEQLTEMDYLADIRAANPAIKVLLSVGGWQAGGFSEAASTEEGRKLFAASCVDAVNNLGLDGIDVDWEYPCSSAAGIASSPADKHTFTLLLQETRAALDSCSGPRKLLTIAAGAGPFFLDNTEMAEVQKSLDYVLIMTYDMSASRPVTGHHTNLYFSEGAPYYISGDIAVRQFIDAGVPAEKLVLGAAFYARMWKNVPNQNRGLHQTTAGGGDFGPTFTALTQSYIDKGGFTRYWDEQAHAPYLFNGDTFMSYDDERSIVDKCSYVRDQGLAGIMYWEHSGDSSGLLLKTMHDQLNA